MKFNRGLGEVVPLYPVIFKPKPPFNAKGGAIPQQFSLLLGRRHSMIMFEEGCQEIAAYPRYAAVFHYLLTKK